MEHYANFSAATTVGSGGYTAGSGVLNVASTSGFPAAGNFSLVIQDQTTLLSTVVLRVSAVNSGTQFAVTAESSDTNANAGDLVFAVLSAAAIDGLRADIIQSGAYASRPSSPHSGDLWIATDSLYQQRWNGSSWDQIFMGRKVTPPLLSDFSTWANQGGASTDDTKGGIYLLAPAASGQNCRLIAKTAPSTPCTITAGMLYNGGITDFGGGGLCMRDSGSGKVAECMYWCSTTRQIGAFHWNSPTSAAGDVFEVNCELQPTVIWFRLQDDGTNRKYFYSMDGVHFIQMYSESNSTFISSFDQIAFDAHAENSNLATGIWIFEYYES